MKPFHCLVGGHLDTPNGARGLGPLAVTFEVAYERLSRLPRMFLEPDGSFVWVNPDEQSPRWQIDGNLQDGGPSLHSVLLQGCCNVHWFLELLDCLLGDQGELVFELVREGEWINEQEFISRFITRDA